MKDTPAKRAVGEARTRDPQLGKLMLYQLSYYRRVKTPQGVFLSAKIGRTFDSARGVHLCFRLQIQRVY